MFCCTGSSRSFLPFPPSLRAHWEHTGLSLSVKGTDPSALLEGQEGVRVLQGDLFFIWLLIQAIIVSSIVRRVKRSSCNCLHLPEPLSGSAFPPVSP